MSEWHNPQERTRNRTSFSSRGRIGSSMISNLLGATSLATIRFILVMPPIYHPHYGADNVFLAGLSLPPASSPVPIQPQSPVLWFPYAQTKLIKKNIPIIAQGDQA